MKPLLRLPSVFLIIILLSSIRINAQVIDSTTILFNMDSVCRNLGYPWEIAYGPDDSLWITEARGYRVVRISSGRTQTAQNVPAQQVLKIPLGVGEINFTRAVNRWPQGGMEGLVIHPDFKTNPAKQWVYLAYVYKQESCPSGTDGTHPNGFICNFRSKIVRCRFYYSADAGNPSLRIPKADTLTIMDTIISNLAGSNDHNSGRLTINPLQESGTYKLYYTIGDMGAGQFNNDTRTNYAQDLNVVEGKILRLNTEPDADGVDVNDPNNKWIPNDNPFSFTAGVVPAGLNGKKSPIYTYGHRNAQGIVWGSVDGGTTYKLYSSEHGDKSDDEVNLIQAGGNYGWPKISGMPDTNYSTTFDAFPNNDILAAQTVNWNEGTVIPTAKRPLFSTFNSPAASIPSSASGNFTWPTIAPSSIEFYKGNIPGWKYSLLVGSLKYGMYRLKLKSTGDFVDSTSSANIVDTFPLLHSWRVRDIALNPISNSGTFWVILDSTGSTSGPTGGFSGATTPTKSGGKVLKLSFKTLITLPVQFISFNGKLLTDKTIKLDWKAETDPNHSYFEVEKSTNNFAFSSIGRINSNTKPPYTLIDPTPNIGNNFYRIKQVDRDGSNSYTKVINIEYNPSDFILTVYPNPIRDVLSMKVSLPKSQSIQVQVSDMQGHIVIKSTRYIANGSGEIKIDTKAWPSQLYSIKIIDLDNKVLATQKIIKL